LPGGKRAGFYSINMMRARYPAWFREDLERLFSLLATGTIRPRVAERISFDEVAEAYRRLKAGVLDGKLVLCPDFPLRVQSPREPSPPSVHGGRRPNQSASALPCGRRPPVDDTAAHSQKRKVIDGKAPETGRSGHSRSAKEVEVVRRAGGRCGSIYSIPGVGSV
jgi:hypothetical protein